ncbi:cysteine-rich motor neuron 1 protein [Elysia marginata]|uniref:Cysteine-rich motor neuron 1 protein n=1 Tax=Elysia marginata TaxID=1093978 RepID=A0AAV4JM87_9GAST|nr:cysteine-rich motor neuron 1 protein [Elysia marginata]
MFCVSSALGTSGSVRFIGLYFTMLCLMCHLVEALKCPPCNKIHCAPRKASRLQCKGGTTTVCAKLEHEQCGGDYSYQGKCDKGLICVSNSTSSTYISRVHSLRSEVVGVCKKS